MVLMPFFSRTRAREGFSLVEILIVVSVTTLLSGFLISYNSTGRQVIALQTERSKIGQMISKAKALALNNYTRSPQPCGYGFFIDYARGIYAIGGYTDAGGCANLAIIDPASFTVLESSTVSRVLRLDSNVPGNRFDAVVFVAPEPKTYVSSRGVVLAGGSGVIGLMGTNGTPTSSVSVSTAGQINF